MDGVVTKEHDVRLSFLFENGQIPVVVEPAAAGLDAAAWCQAGTARIDELLRSHGAVLFRNFYISSPREFERTARAANGELFAEYGDLPRNVAGERIYHSTPYPADQMILWHNESSHLSCWPLRITFYCITPAAGGGATPLVDTRRLMTELDADVVAAFRRHGLTYVRNFTDGVEPTWQQFFKTTERSVAEARARESGSEAEWRRDGGLRLRSRARGIVTHPRTGDELFFNQVQLHHIACVDADTRDGLRALFDDEDLPRNVCYGDGSPIPDTVLEHIVDVCERTCIRFAWQAGDMIVLDNMRIAHARDTFTGKRQIAVALAQMYEPT